MLMLKDHKLGQKGLKIYEKGLEREFLDQKYLFLCGIFSGIMGYPPFLLTEKFSFANAMIELWMASFFSEDEEGAPSGTAATVPSSSRVPAVMGAHHPQSQSHQQPGGGQTSGHPMV